jgi:hypothetical protein
MLNFKYYLVSVLAPKDYICYEGLLSGSSVITACHVLELWMEKACIPVYGG